MSDTIHPFATIHNSEEYCPAIGGRCQTVTTLCDEHGRSTGEAVTVARIDAAASLDPALLATTSTLDTTSTLRDIQRGIEQAMLTRGKPPMSGWMEAYESAQPSTAVPDHPNISLWEMLAREHVASTQRLEAAIRRVLDEQLLEGLEVDAARHILREALDPQIWPRLRVPYSQGFGGEVGGEE